MERKTYLNRYRLSVDHLGIPLVIRRSEDEATFQADDETTGEKVAAQVVSVPALSPEMRERLETEAQAAEKLDHLNIPKLRDFGFEGEQLIYITEYLEGTTAENWIATQGPMPASVVLRIGSQVVNALGAATFHGVVHYGVNPSNIMLVPGQTPDGEWPLIKVLNFVGIAPSPGVRGANGTTQLDPVDFASPEQSETGEVDFRSQIYSLGCTLWFLLKGVAPAGGAAAVQHASGVAAPVRRLLESMLASDPADRPLDPLAFHQQIQDCLAQVERREIVTSKLGLPTASPPPKLPVRSAILESKPRGPLAWRPLALAALFMALAAMAAMVLARRTHQHQAIGVPVGVPQASAAPTIAPAQQIASAPTDTANNSLPTPQSNEPPVLTSTAGVSDDQTSSPAETITTNDAEQSAQVASNDVPAAQPNVETTSTPSVQNALQPAVPLVASNLTVAAAESIPPPQGPAPQTALDPRVEVASVSQSSNERAKTLAEKPSISREVSTEEDVQKDISINDVAAAPEKTTRILKAKPVVRRAQAVIPSSSAPPSVPHGSVRARDLGTTSDGNLAVGKPTDERVYAAPLAAPVREEKPPRRARPTPRETTIDNLPVLPALPPDE